MWRVLLSEDGTAGVRGASKHWQDREHFEGMYLLLYISPQPLAASAIVRQEHHSTSREDATQLGWPRCFAPRLGFKDAPLVGWVIDQSSIGFPSPHFLI